MFFGSDSNCPPFSQLIGEYVKRSNNHQALLAALKDVNNMIQKAAKLRGKISKLNTHSVSVSHACSFLREVGGPKTRVVAACRNAIKSNNIHSLFQIITMGHTAEGNSAGASSGNAKSAPR